MHMMAQHQKFWQLASGDLRPWLRQRHIEHMILTLRRQGQHLPGGIHMPLHEMPAETIPGAASGHAIFHSACQHRSSAILIGPNGVRPYRAIALGREQHKLGTANSTGLFRPAASAPFYLR